MEMTGERSIPASPEATWAALNDPEVLKDCVPGCEAIERVSDTEYRATLSARIGPVSARFRGVLRLSDLDPPRGYALSFEGQGGAAGFGKGRARVELAPETTPHGAATRLRYQVSASVGGRLAQLGSRLVDAAARKLADEFFTAFETRLAAATATAAPDPHAPRYHDPHFPEPVPRDPTLPDLDEVSLAYFAASSLVVFLVALFVLL